MPDGCDFCSTDDVDQGEHDPGCINDEIFAPARRFRASLERIQGWLNGPDELFMETADDEDKAEKQDVYDEAYSLIRNFLDMPENFGERDIEDCPHLATSTIEEILTDLGIINDYQYGRDELSHLAISLSLCPMHFQDWAACFDDEVDECSQIRAIFPYGHDT